MLDTLGAPRPVPPGRKFPFNRLTLAMMEDRCVRCLKAVLPHQYAGLEHGGILCDYCRHGRGDAA